LVNHARKRAVPLLAGSVTVAKSPSAATTNWRIISSGGTRIPAMNRATATIAPHSIAASFFKIRIMDRCPGAA